MMGRLAKGGEKGWRVATPDEQNEVQFTKQFKTTLFDADFFFLL